MLGAIARRVFGTANERFLKRLKKNVEAINALEANPLFAATLGQEIVGEFIKVKRMEWTEYSRHVSDWEVQHE